MTTQNWERISALFEAAAERPAPQRAAFLREACKDNAALRHEVESLLAHDAAVDAAFLAVPEPPTVFRSAPTPAADEARVGSSIGEYQLRERIASGGMGTVYRARQEKLRRDVAVKVVRPGLSAESALRRLEHEAMFLARMRHPHIAQVFEAGTFADAATGATLPYFVMELVEGAQPITTYCRGTPQQSPERKPGDEGDQPRREPAAPQPPTGVGGSEIPLRGRLELFLQVCDAVHHGHQRGLIHRDLKPGNILVDAAGQVKIIDFGVARSTDADITLTTLHTDSGRFIGTLQYMSPEQCSADVADLDVRSDVYSLGVVLYELVCDRLPYDLGGATVYSAARIVCDQPADSPRQINPKIPRDLEAILLKCLEKDRARRYQSAAQLADDLRRYLDGETIIARSPGLYRRTVRWVSRHAIAATAIACVTMLGISSAATWIGLYLADERPSRVWVSDDKREVQLVTAAGRRIGRSLSTGYGAVFAIPKFLKHAGKRIACIGLPDNVEVGVQPGLYAFDADAGLHPDIPLWHRQLLQENIPPPPVGRVYTPDSFELRDLLVLDVFAEVPGPELVTVWTHIFSWGATAIYDLDGNLLYQLWHDGAPAPGNLFWLADEGVLVVRCAYCTHEPWLVSPRLPRGSVSIPAVFAVRPRLGEIHRNLLSVPELPEWRDLSVGRDTSTQPRPDALWYKFIWPLDRISAMRFLEEEPAVLRPLSARAAAHISIGFITPDDESVGACFWDIDATGAAITTPSASDGYRQARDMRGLPLPPPQHFRLVDLATLLADPFGEIAFGTAAGEPSGL